MQGVITFTHENFYVYLKNFFRENGGEGRCVKIIPKK